MGQLDVIIVPWAGGVCRRVLVSPGGPSLR